ncbi:MAG TPA: porin [Myxococcus sp.]|nr:porin [Myxococcus sp.]
MSTKVVFLLSTLLSTGAWATPGATEPSAASESKPPESSEPREPAPAPEKKPAAAPGASITAAPGKGITVTSEDGKFSSTLRTRVQMRATGTGVKPQPGQPRQWTQEANVRTVRLTLQGHVLSPDLKYNVQLALGGNDFETGSSTPLFDAWVEYTGIRDLNFRVGQFFVPFDRARTIRESSLQFVDRPGIISEMTLDRDVGVMLSSADLFGVGGRLGYNLGLFGGEGRNRFGNSTPGLLYTLRLYTRPFGAFDDDVEGDLKREPKPRLMLGVAGAFNQKTNRLRSTTGATSTQGTFQYVHTDVDAVFKYRGVSVLAEVLYRWAAPTSRSGTVNGQEVREYSRSGWGYLVQAGYMLNDTFEATARWDQQRARAGTDPAYITQVNQQGREVGVGLNAYLNGHAFKIQADYTRQFGRAGSARQLVRLQLDASF